MAAADKVKVDSCSFRSPNIVPTIGESYGKHHLRQYGYPMPTTPRQIKREASRLSCAVFDVVTPLNLTSFVFKMSFYARRWTKETGGDYPLFPELFRKSGYSAVPYQPVFMEAKAAVYDFRGGSFE